MAEQKRLKRQNFIARNKLGAVAGVVLFAAIVLKMIFLSKKIDSAGTGFYLTAYTFVMVIAVMLSMSLKKVVKKAVSYRKSRNQYKNAVKIMKTGSILGLALGLILFLAFLLFAGRMTNRAFHMGAYGTFTMIFAAASFPFILVSEVVLGCFDGFDFDMPDGAAKIIFGISDLLLSIALVVIACGIGEKHGKLLHDDNVVFAFGAAGAAAGFCGACLMTMVWLLALFHAFRQKLRGKIAEDTSRGQESFGEQMMGMLSAGGESFTRYVMWYGTLLVNQLLFFRFFRITGAEGSGIYPAILLFGDYLKEMVWYIFPLILALMLGDFTAGNLEKIMKKDDLYHGGLRIVMGLKQYLCFILPIICVVGVVQGALQESVFAGGSHALLLTISCVFFSLSYLESEMLKGLGKEWLGTGCGLAAFVVQTAGALFFLKECHDIMPVIYCNLIFSLVFFCGCSAFLFRFCVYRKNLFRHLIMPLVAVFAAVIAAVLCMFLKAAGNLIAVIIALFAACLVHMVTLVVTGCIKEGEFHEFPQGNLLAALGRIMGMYS